MRSDPRNRGVLLALYIWDMSGVCWGYIGGFKPEPI